MREQWGPFSPWPRLGWCHKESFEWAEGMCVSVEAFEQLKTKLAALQVGTVPNLSQTEIGWLLGGVKAVFPVGLCGAEMRSIQAEGLARRWLLGMAR